MHASTCDGQSGNASLCEWMHAKCKETCTRQETTDQKNPKMKMHKKTLLHKHHDNLSQTPQNVSTLREMLETSRFKDAKTHR